MDRSRARTLLEQLVRLSRHTIEENCAAFEQTATTHGENATLSPRQLSRWMAGEVDSARPVAQRTAELHWGYPFEILTGPALSPSDLAVRAAGAGAFGQRGFDQEQKGLVDRPILEAVEALRRGLHDAVSGGAASEASLDEWELTVVNHGQATRFRPAGALLVELASDFADLERVLLHRQTATAQRRLTRVTAQMAGLMFLTLIKLNEPLAARNWARTARVAADEAGDRAVRSWVRAQEAYVHYYAGNLIEAVATARHAQALAGKSVCVGLPLAAALEARAQAAMGHISETRAALDLAQTAVERLDAESLLPSAFGYQEAQLRFHEGNAYTHLRDTSAAWVAQDRALALYPTGDFLDRTLIQLDRAVCLGHDGDIHQSISLAIGAIAELTDDQRAGLVLLRGQDVLDSLTAAQRALPVAREYRELLMLSTERTDP